MWQSHAFSSSLPHPSPSLRRAASNPIVSSTKTQRGSSRGRWSRHNLLFLPRRATTQVGGRDGGRAASEPYSAFARAGRRNRGPRVRAVCLVDRLSPAHGGDRRYGRRRCRPEKRSSRSQHVRRGRRELCRHWNPRGRGPTLAGFGPREARGWSLSA
jgi:hypothetical protein